MSALLTFSSAKQFEGRWDRQRSQGLQHKTMGVGHRLFSNTGARWQMDGLIDERGREKKKEGRARMSHRTKPYDRPKGGAAGKTIHEDKLTQANAKL